MSPQTLQEPQSHLGLVVYSWGAEAQNAFLAECLAPAVEELRSWGVERFWFDRFDARGPHIFALMSGGHGARDTVREELSARVERHLANSPSRQELRHEELVERHEACRGKVMCELDRRSGLATNNTFELFEHPPDGYPFTSSEGVPEPERLWQLIDELSMWSIAQLGGRTVTSAILWMAALDRALCAATESPSDYWRYHATTLLVGLDQRLAADEAAVLASLPDAPGAKNKATFSRVWASDAVEVVCPPLAELIEVAVAGTESVSTLPRDIAHTTLKQMGIPTKLEIPLVLYAWGRSLQ